MREILFKGKRKDNEEWIIGYYSYANDGHGTELHMISEKSTGLRYPVIPETVGQYTGLTDKNGKKIFEGDIIKNIWTGDVHTVDYCVDCAVWVLPCITDERRETTFNSYDGDDYEVIGNIHDNSELLKGGAE